MNEDTKTTPEVRLGGALIFVRRQISVTGITRIDGEGALLLLIPRGGFWSRPRARAVWMARMAMRHG